jgi:invasion protein IalB
MHNDLDDRRRYDQRSRRQQPRHEEPDDARHDLAEHQHDAYAEDPHGHYPEAGHDQPHAAFPEHGYQEHAEYQEQAGYEEPAPRRSRLVPILTIVAAVLVVALGVGAALYFLGVFGGSAPAPASLATGPDTAAPEPPPAGGADPSVTPVGTAPSPDAPAGEATAANPDVPDAVVSIAPPAQGEPPVRSVHDAWQVRCDTPAGAQGEQCVLMQFVTAEDRENVGLTVIVLKTADQKARIMRILAPLGVLLPSGLGLKIDETDIGRAGFVRCLPNGCVAEVILEDQLLKQLETGKTATFIIFQTPEEGIGIPISLAGFTPGFAALP